MHRQIIPKPRENLTIWQGGALKLNQAQPLPKQLNFKKLSDASRFQIQWLSDAKSQIFTRFWYIFLFCFLFSWSAVFSEDSLTELFSSSPEQVMTLSSDDFLIGGVINPLSGQPSLRQTDLIAKGAQNIVLTRIFIPQFAPLKNKGTGKLSKDSYAGWVHFPHVRLNLCTFAKQGKAKEIRACVVDSNGVALVFALEDGSTKLESNPCGICNGIIAPSGKYDPRNTKIRIEKNWIVVQTSEGAERFYWPTSTEAIHCDNKAYECSLCLLKKEILPNGRVLRYFYENRDLVRVESMDPEERFVYATIHLNTCPFKQKGSASTHTGTTAAFSHATGLFYKDNDISKNLNLLFPLNLTNAQTPFFQDETVTYQKNAFFYGNKESHTSLFLYSGQHRYFQCLFGEFLERQRNLHRLRKQGKTEELSSTQRTKTLFLPGANDILEPVFTFDYDFSVPDFSPGKTTVNHWDGSKTVFFINSKMLPNLIAYYDKEDLFKKEKIFDWYDNQWLKSIEIRDESHRTLSKKSFKYDSFGNPEQEIFEGNLTGNGLNESYTIKRKFSKDGRHLLLQEEHDEGKVVIYTYKPTTNLVETVVTKDRDLVVSKEIRKYDDSHNLISVIEDDGKVVKATNYILRNTSPFLHMPEWIEKTYQENGITILLTRSQLFYDQYGNVKQEDVYDGNNKFCYTLHKEYNARGDLLSETNALGHKAIYTYNAHGQLETSTCFSGKNTKTITYDLKRRSKFIQEKGTDGCVHVSAYAYDHNDCIIKETDTFDHETHFVYDPLSLQPVQTMAPVLQTPHGTLPVITHASYDILGRRLEHIDANGNTTHYTYNAYGSPIEVIHPDQSKEIYRYTKSGRLSSHTDPEGLVTRYTYDGLGRVRIKAYEHNNQAIAQETFAYQGLFLSSTTNKLGYVTTYTYDGAGRKASEEIEGRKTTFSYGPLGNVCTVCHEDEKPLYIHYQYDFLGNILQKTYADHSNTLKSINYTYDADGNVKTIKRNIDGKVSINTFEYDSQQRLKRHIDALGYITTTQYNEHHINEYGQRVLQKKIITPKNIAVVETHDPYGRISKEEKLNPNKESISSEEHIYDACGNMLQNLEHVHIGTEYLDTKTTAFHYDQKHQIKSFIRAYGTPLERTTLFAYTPGGKTKTKTQPDGTILAYEYDSLGYLKSLSSSDDKIKHTFRYDLLGNLLQASDGNVTVERECDPFGNVRKEEYNGICIEKTYDKFNRPLKVTLPDSSAIVYAYDPLFCRSVERYSTSGEHLYTHHYDEYDLDGHLRSETLLANLGKATYAKDLKRQSISINTPFLQQKCTYDEVGNLIRLITNGHEKSFSYDDLDQLISENNLEYKYDSTLNRIKNNELDWQYNSLDECTSYQFDLNGNLIQKGNSNYRYDPLNRLIEAEIDNTKVCLTYDPLGRRIAKTVYIRTNGNWKINQQESYLYDGENDIGTIDANGQIKQLRILGISQRNIPSSIAIELEGRTYSPIQDVQGNIRGLVSLTGAIVAKSDFSAFGEPLHEPKGPFNPWQYASKRFDPDLNLIDFGKRFYDPSLGRWLTTDPAGFVDGMNLYAFLKNNPYLYVDPDGRFVWFAIPFLAGTFGVGGVTIGLPSLVAVGSALTASAIGTVLGIATYQIYKTIDANQNTVNNELTTTEEDVKEKATSNPYAEPAGEDVMIVDASGNVIPVKKGERVTGSYDGQWIQVRDKNGNPTGLRKDGPHSSNTHSHPNALKPHAHVPEVTNNDGTPWLQINH